MTFRDALQVLRVHEIEQADPEGRVLPHAAREAATRRGLQAAGLGECPGPKRLLPRRRWIRAAVARARFLAEDLPRASRGRLNPERLGRVLGVLAAGSWIAALLLGLGTESALGGRRLDLLSLPLLGVLAWNALALSASGLRLGIRSVRRRDRGVSQGPRRSVLLDAALRLAAGAGARLVGPAGESAAPGLGVFWRAFVDQTLPFWTNRVQAVLHVAAACFASGVVAGLYLRGLVRDFRVTWESTWLSATQVQAVLGALLTPAAWITGLEVPDVGAVQGPGREGPAAVWIHLFAVTLFLFVVAPRLVLALFHEIRARRALDRLVGASAATRLLQKVAEGRPVRGWVVGLGRRLDPQTREAVLEALHGGSGAGSVWKFGPAAAYETLHELAAKVEEQGLRALGPDEPFPEQVAAVVSAGQAPEPSLHVAVLQALVKQGTPVRVLVVDPTGRGNGGAWRAAAERLGLPWRLVSLRAQNPEAAAQERRVP